MKFLHPAFIHHSTTPFPILSLENCFWKFFFLVVDLAMASGHWNRITTQKLTGFGIGVSLFALLILKSQHGFVFIVDDANLLFHEAGHPVVGLFSSRLEVYGGTLGQLVFPAVVAVSFWRRREPLSFAAGVIWFFENWLNIARYMADARAQELRWSAAESTIGRIFLGAGDCWRMTPKSRRR